jgi:D-alanine-D-alanine ligase-like ATP-grasp enzyme
MKNNDKSIKTIVSSDVQLKKMAILLLNDLLEEDFDPILSALEFKKDLLIITNVEFKRTYPDVVFMVDNFENSDSLIKKLLEFKIKNNIEFCGIIGLDEEYRYSFSKLIADTFKLSSNSRITLDLATDKYAQILELKKGGVAVPDFKLFENYDEISGFKLPSVIKPVRGISSLYVYKNNTSQDLKNNFKLLEAYKTDSNFLSLASSDKKKISSKDSSNSKSKSDVNKKPFIIEEFIDGNEYSCDFFVGKNQSVLLLRVAKKLVSKNYFPFFEGYYLFNPDEDSDSEFSTTDLISVCKKIAKSLNVTTGLCMVDFRFDQKLNKIVVIETTTRPGVDDFISLMSKYYGYISMNVALRNIFGMLDVNSFKKIPSGKVAIVYLLAPKKGALSKFDTAKLSKLKTLEIDVISKYFDVGEKVEPLGLSDTPPIVGHVIVKNINYKDLDNVITLIRNNTSISVK